MAYTVHCVHADRQDWAASLRAQLGEAVAGLDASVSTVRVLDGYPAPAGRDPNSPAVVVYLGSPAGAASAECSRQVSKALADHLLVLPCVSRLASFPAHTPEPLHRFNGLEWPGKRAPAKVVHFVLEALGLEERQRRVFLSHRRSDALVLTEQLHDRLVKSRFWPFVDRFGIDPAEDVQQRIFEALEEAAFVLLMESPQAADSRWVHDEVYYALAASLGILIVSFPEARELPRTQNLPRIRLNDTDLKPGRGGQRVLKAGTLDRLALEVEAIHAKALVRRRNRLVLHARDAAEKAGFVATERPDGLLLVSDPAPAGASRGAPRHLVHFVPRPPQPKDLFFVDAERRRLRDPRPEAVLIHATSRLSRDSSGLLQWCLAGHDVRLITDLRVGKDWMRPSEGRQQ
jgi:hypothetical protein